jgi:hypothetical protein
MNQADTELPEARKVLMQVDTLKAEIRHNIRSTKEEIKKRKRRK